MKYITSLPNLFSKRFLIYISGLFIIACGSNLFVNASLGVAPFSSIAYALTFIFPIQFSLTTLFMNMIHLVLEGVLLHSFSKSYIIQFLMTLLYSAFLQSLSPFLTPFQPEYLIQQFFLAIIACILMAIGMTLMILSNFVVLPSEGFVGALTFVLHKDFSTTKTYADIAEVTIAFLLAFIFSGKIVIGIGTLLSAFFTGFIHKLFLSFCKDRILRFMGE